MKISAIEAIPCGFRESVIKAVRTAGSPPALAEGSGDYRWWTLFPVLYAVHLETARVKVKLDSRLTG